MCPTSSANCECRELHGFRLDRPVPVPELRAVASQGVHLRTGLRVLCLEADDPENLLAVCLPTVPTDDTGVPHIAEHVVLGGSAAYPLRDPFVELLKCSMATFANAMTYADRTVFPVASNVPADFCNLARVYLDAVFHPLLRPESFRQEGYFLSPDPESRSAAGPLREQGVVHSEMRGAYAELETVLQTAVLAHLLPDTPYRYDAGGIPAAIAKLRYEDFLAFCEAHYRADRALVFLYGDLGVATWLPLLDEAVAQLPAAAPAMPPQIPAAKPWESPREQDVPVALSPDETPADRSAAVLAWCIGNAVDLDGQLEMDLLDHLLLGHPAAPLQRALTESGLGQDVFLGGYDSERREAVFQVGLRGCRHADRHRFLELVLGVLRRVVSDGVPMDTVRAALNQMEYSRRLVDGQYPVLLAEEAFGFWAYGDAPVEALSLELPLQRLRSRALGDPGFLADLVRRRLLDNPHRLLVSACPDARLAAAEQCREDERLAAVAEAIGEAGRRELQEQARSLLAWQETPDAPEALAQLPRLRRSDLPVHPPAPTCLSEDAGDHVLLANHVPANGLEDCIQAVELPFLAPPLLELLPLFAYCLGRMGTERGDYAFLAERIAQLGGGVRAGYRLRRAQAGGAAVPVLTIRGSSLGGSFADALDLVREVLLSTRFEPGERLAELLRQRRSRLLANVLGAGHVVAGQQASAGLSAALAVRNLWHGPPQLRLADRLAGGLPGSLVEVAEALEQIRLQVLAAGPGVLAHTGSPDGTDMVREHAMRFAPATPLPFAVASLPGIDRHLHTQRSALTVAANGAHAAWCVPAPVFPDPASPLLELAAHLLSLGLAWEEVRAKGGAYGASCEYDSLFGTFSLLSYRDPSPARTIGFFEGLANHVEELTWSSAEIEEALPAVVRTDQRCLRPPQLTEVALHDHLQQITYPERDSYRQQLLAAAPDAVAEAVRRVLRGAAQSGGSCVLGDAELLAELGSKQSFTTAPLLGGPPGEVADDAEMAEGRPKSD